MGITRPLSLDCAEDLQRQYIKDIQQQVPINIAIVIISLVLKILRDVVIAASSEDQSDPHRPIPGSSLISAAIVMDSLLTKHWQHPICLIYLIYFTYLIYLCVSPPSAPDASLLPRKLSLLCPNTAWRSWGCWLPAQHRGQFTNSPASFCGWFSGAF